MIVVSALSERDKERERALQLHCSLHCCSLHGHTAAWDYSMGLDQENNFIGWSGNHSKHPAKLMDQIFTMTNDSINSLEASVKVIREDFGIQ